MIDDNMYVDLLVYDTYNNRRSSSYCDILISNEYLESNIKIGTKLLVSEMFCDVVERNDDLWYSYECTKATILTTVNEYFLDKKTKIA